MEIALVRSPRASLRRARRRTLRLAAPLLACFTTQALGCRPGSGSQLPGAVIEAEVSGAEGVLRQGDRVVRWELSPFAGTGVISRGAVHDPLDLADAFFLQRPLGRVTLHVVREGRSISVSVPPSAPAPASRPALSDAERALYEAGARAAGGGDFDAAFEHWGRLGALLEDRATHAVWLHLETGRRLMKAERIEPAYGAFRKAVERAVASGDTRLAAFASYEAGRLDAESSFSQGRQAAEALRRALDLRRTCCGRDLWYAQILRSLARLSWERSIDVAATEVYLREGLEIAERLSPNSSLHGAFAYNLSLCSEFRGDLRETERFRTVAAQIAVARGDDRGIFYTRIGLGLLAFNRGDVAAAETFTRAALRHLETAAIPDGQRSVMRADGLRVLAGLQWERGNVEAAYALARESTLSAEDTPRGRVESLALLAMLAIELERPAEAESILQSRYNPDTLGSADGGGLIAARALTALGRLRRAQGDLEGARRVLAQSRAAYVKDAPGSRYLSETLLELAAVDLLRGDLKAGNASTREALALLAQLAPGSTDEMRALQLLGLLSRRSGSEGAAVGWWRRAAASAETQRQGLGSDIRERLYAARLTDEIFSDLVGGLVSLRQPEQAFAALEQSRARSFLEHLSRRDIPFAGQLSPELLDEEHRLRAESERTRAELGELGAGKDDARIADLRGRLADVRVRASRLEARIHQEAPAVARIRSAETLDAAAVRSALDPGTVLLAFSVGPPATPLGYSSAGRNTLLFILSRPLSQPRVMTLPISRRDLDRRVSVFRALLARGKETSEVEEALLAQGQRLFDDLIAPAAPFIAESERIVLIPDGPLHALPFPALVRRRQPLQYFVEWKPLHVAASASVYVELRKRSRATAARGASPELVVFADPEANPDAPAALALSALPGARAEARELAAIFPGSRVYLGPEASEEQLRSVDPNVRYLHFATHAFVDERFPLNSGLVLSPSHRDGDGVLEAWEILDHFRTNAELVTLSGCDTGQGAVLGGEGSVGLTRAFHHAGARSVLASLWAVSDRSTADLMAVFYRELKAGRHKDEALQAAQLALLKEGDPVRFGHPFHWAGFRLFGDWR